MGTICETRLAYMLLTPSVPPPIGVVWWMVACVAAAAVRNTAYQSQAYTWLWVGATLRRIREIIPADALALATVGFSSVGRSPSAGVVMDVIGMTGTIDIEIDLWNGNIWIWLATVQYIAMDPNPKLMGLRAAVMLLRRRDSIWFWSAVMAQGPTLHPLGIIVATGTWILAEMAADWMWVGLGLAATVQLVVNTIKV